jgi:6-phosphogluconate dehydrogenase
LFLAGRAKGKSINGFHLVKDFVDSLERPRKVMMPKAGPAADGFIEQLLPFLEEGDMQ